MSDAPLTAKVTPGVAQGADLDALFNRFRHVCDQLENGGLSLEDALRVYEEGVSIEQMIKAELNKAERRVVEIIGEDGVIRPFDVEKDGRPKGK